MSKYTPVYAKARDVAQKQKFADPEWSTFFDTQNVKALFGESGLSSAKSSVPDAVRKKFADLAKSAKVEPGFVKKAGKFIYDATQNSTSPGDWKERAALVEFMRHLYRAQKSGAQDVWVYSPAKDYPKHVFDELTGDDAAVKRKLGYDDEIFSADERDLMCDALHLARKTVMDAQVKLTANANSTRDVVARWFIDSGSTDKTDDAIKKLNDGLKKIAVSCSSTTLTFTDYLDWRAKRNKYFGAAFRGGEGGGFPIIYLEGAFTNLAGNKNKLWLAAETIIHELSHHDISTQDHKYDSDGLKPGASFPYAQAIDNADSWGYFVLDLAGYLTEGVRNATLK